MVKDVVSGTGLKSLETGGFLELGRSETSDVRVTESNQGGCGTMMGLPLELGEHGGGCRGCRIIGRVLQQPETCGSGNILWNGGG